MSRSDLRIAIVGGGPGGLFLATLLKFHAPSDEVVVFEQNPKGATYGFGVGFTDLTLEHFQAAVPGLDSEIRNHSVTWDTIEIRHGGHHFQVAGNPFSAISRAVLLDLLLKRAEAVGVEIRFGYRLDDVTGLADDFDLVVGADGVNSAVREVDPEAFGAEVRSSDLRYIWFGSEAPTGELFKALTFAFAEDEHGPFGIHAYPFGEGAGESRTAFIVETDVSTWRKAGLDRYEHNPLAPGANDLESMALCERLFADHLGGWPLIGNNSKWTDFANVSCRRWHSGKYVLLGDAAHTAHFSLGSGTKMAMEDAISLASALQKGRSDGLSESLDSYEGERRPRVSRLQQASEPSRMWWENFRHVLHLDPHQFAFNFLTRTGLMTYERLRQRDHHFTGAVLGRLAPGARPTKELSFRPLGAPLSKGTMTTRNRVVGDGRVRPTEDPEDARARAEAYARCGAGVVLVGPIAAEPASGDGQSGGSLAPPSFGAELGCRVVGEVAPPLRPSSTAELPRVSAALRLAAEFEWDGLAIRVSLDGGAANADGGQAAIEWLRATVRHVTAALGDAAPLAVVLEFAAATRSPLTLDSVEQYAEILRDGGVSVVLVQGPAQGSPLEYVAEEEALALIADTVRNRVGLTTVLTGARTEDTANTAVLGGRADLVAGWPQLAGLGWNKGSAKS